MEGLFSSIQLTNNSLHVSSFYPSQENIIFKHAFCIFQFYYAWFSNNTALSCTKPIFNQNGAQTASVQTTGPKFRVPSLT